MANPQIHAGTPSPIEICYKPVPDDLHELVNAFFIASVASERVEEILPAYSAQFLVFLSGSAALEDDDSGNYQTILCTAPLLEAKRFFIYGPARMVGASLTPLGWQCLGKLPVSDVNNRTVSPDELLEPEEIAQFEMDVKIGADGDSGLETIIGSIAKALRSRRDRLNADQVAFVLQVTAWLSDSLNPQLSDLLTKTEVSERTAQRLCKRYFGVPPRALIKRFRAIRAAMMLANPRLPPNKREEIIDAYFDQSHLIRDIRRYTGRTPSALAEENFASEILDPDAHGASARILQDP